LPSRRTIAIAVTVGALLAAIIVSIAVPFARTPTYHRYADHRAWLGIPNASDVLSNLPFLIAGVWFALRAQTMYARLASLGVVAIGIGSAAYHVSPGDVALAFDFGPIVVTLMIVTAALIADRIGEAAGRIALVGGVALAVGSVVLWYAGGGTHGGTVTPYGAVQAMGIALPALLALIAPGEIPRRPLLVGVLFFVIARLCTANDHQLLAALGISGHSLKHVAAAAAAACGLAALTRTTSPAWRASLSSS
jgi:hypothetical protein